MNRPVRRAPLHIASRYGSFVALLLSSVALSSCTSPHIQVVQEFRAARKAGQIEKARSYLDENPRVWYEAHEGEGMTWKIGAGRWKEWDTHFNGISKLGRWHVEGDRVWAVAEEMNDYFRLIERRDMPRYRITYFINDQGKIGGYMISAADPDAPPTPTVSRYDEFEAWALENDADEWEYLRPGGSLDPTGDRAPRTRELANRWRVSVGLAPIN